MSDTDRIIERSVFLAKLNAEIEALQASKAEVSNEIAALIGGRGNRSVEVDGKKIKRTAAFKEVWDREMLLRAVLDSRRFDKIDGELVDENPIDKVMHTWLLPKPRLTALKERGLSPEDFCTSEFRGWRIEVSDV